MNQEDVESSITTQYISNVRSRSVRILLKSGRFYRGLFIKDNQKESNSLRNRWIITIDLVEIMVDGNDIDSFFPFKH